MRPRRHRDARSPFAITFVVRGQQIVRRADHRVAGWALLILLAVSAQSPSHAQPATPEQTVIWDVSSVRRDLDEWAGSVLASLERFEFPGVASRMVTGEIAEPIRKVAAWHERPILSGNINYLLPTPFQPFQAADPLHVRMPVLVRCRTSIGERSHLHCRARDAFLGPPARSLDVQWWHLGLEVSARDVEARFLELFRRFKDEPASR